MTWCTLKAFIPFYLSVLILPLMACGSQGFNIKQLAKSDIDMVSDIVLMENREALKTLLEKLYKRNPRELTKQPEMTLSLRSHMIFTTTGRLVFEELNNKEEIEAMDLAFDPGFKGDRVFALMVGLTSMLRQSYNYDDDFFIHEELNAQALYNSARNIEVMAWKLKNKSTRDGKPFLVTSTLNGVIDNTSYERLYGQLIHTQDLMAKIIADRNNRTINTVIKGTLSVFLPI